MALGDDQDHTIAMEILAEASTKEVFTPKAQRQLGRLYLPLVDDAPDRISEVLDILEHDGYIESCRRSPNYLATVERLVGFAVR